MERFGSSNCSNNEDNRVKKQRRRDSTSEGIDYISNLPEVILLHILSFLSLKEWIIVSILSRRWRYFWTKMSSLNLDEFEIIRNTITKDLCCPVCGDISGPENSCQCLQHSLRAARRKFVEFVDRILLLHSGCTIDHFRLSFYYNISDGYIKRIDSWVHFAMTSNIKEVELNFCDINLFRFFDEKGLVVGPTYLPQQYDLPRGCFAPKMLQTLNLIYCKLRASSFRVFSSLRRLSLQHVEVLDHSIGELVSKCPVLEDFSLEDCLITNEFLVSEDDIMIKGLSLINCKEHDWLTFHVDISTPYLQMLTIVGTYLTTLSIRKARHLVHVKIDIRTKFADHIQGCGLGSLLSGLNHCQTLSLTSWCIQVQLSRENQLLQLPTLLHNLRHLNLVVGLIMQELHGISCLLRSSPNLESMTLNVHNCSSLDWVRPVLEEGNLNLFEFDESTFWVSQSLPFYCLQNSLKNITINGFVGRSNEVEIVRFLLENARVLERMVINSIIGANMSAPSTSRQQISPIREQLNNLRQLLNFPRASANAHIEIIRNHNLKNM